MYASAELPLAWERWRRAAARTNWFGENLVRPNTNRHARTRLLLDPVKHWHDTHVLVTTRGVVRM